MQVSHSKPTNQLFGCVTFSRNNKPARCKTCGSRWGYREPMSTIYADGDLTFMELQSLRVARVTCAMCGREIT